MANKKERGLLLILSGPSGCGKGTVMERLLASRDDTVLSISVTTRAPRPGDIDGGQYYFRTKEQVEQLIAEDALLEYACYSGNYYGTPRAAVEEHLAAGRNVILEIEVQGAMQVMRRCDDYVSVFLAVPSLEELERRLRGRGTETEEGVRARLDAAREEITYISEYQYLVVNDVVDEAVHRLNAIIDAEKLRYSRSNTILEELNYAESP